MDEIWRPIPDANRYEVSSLGRIRTAVVGRRGRAQAKHHIMATCDDGGGYQHLSLIDNSGKRVCRKVHRLVATAFLGDPPADFTCNHKDGNKTNNCIDNLEWITRQANCQHAYDIAIHKPLPSHRHPHAKLTYEYADEIRRAAQAGATQVSLARDYHVSQTLIWRVLMNKAWRCDSHH